jgi:hypothetical protein
MISFSQILILIFLSFLLFGDSRQFFNKLILFIVNLKTLIHKFLSTKHNDKNLPK